MKIKKIIVSLFVLFTFITISGCNKKSTININKIKDIANMATLECYYHNVAKSEKAKQWILQKNRKFWIEYTGIVTLGIDASKIELSVNDLEITITLPEGKVLDTRIDETSWNVDSIIESKDGFFTNKITADDCIKVIAEAQEAMKATAQENTQLLDMARERVKTLIENYVNMINEITGEKYTIIWK